MPMTIGQVAKAAGVGVETIRFYEREGLIPEPARRESGYREYPLETIQRLRFIRLAKKLGFTLREIHELLELRVESGQPCGGVLRITQAKIADIERRILNLDKIMQTLAGLAVDCEHRNPTERCPILGALEKNEESST